MTFEIYWCNCVSVCPIYLSIKVDFVEETIFFFYKFIFLPTEMKKERKLWLRVGIIIMRRKEAPIQPIHCKNKSKKGKFSFFSLSLYLRLRDINTQRWRWEYLCLLGGIFNAGEIYTKLGSLSKIGIVFPIGMDELQFIIILCKWCYYNVNIKTTQAELNN